MTTNEIETFRKMSRGDEGAFEYFFKKYYGRLYNYCYDLLKDSLAAEEIVEELFLRIWEKRDQIVVQTSPAAYFYRTAYNNSLNYLKHKKVEDKFLLYQTHQAFEEIEKANNSFPLSTLIEKEYETKLQNSLEKLPDQCRQIFLMSRFEGKKNKEIAEILQVSVNTVKTQLLRALTRIQKDLKHLLIVLFFKN